jgi:hypothetical protein
MLSPSEREDWCCDVAAWREMADRLKNHHGFAPHEDRKPFRTLSIRIAAFIRGHYPHLYDESIIKLTSIPTPITRELQSQLWTAYASAEMTLQAIELRMRNEDAHTPADPAAGPAPDDLTATQDDIYPAQRRGQRLPPAKEKLYRNVLKTAKKLPYRVTGNMAKIAAEHNIDVATVRKILKWGRRHELI